MGFFSKNYDRPGPGVSKDEPRKKGAARFIEIFFRDFADLVKLSILFTLSVLPSATAFAVSMFFDIIPFMSGETAQLSIFFILLSLLLAYPVGGSLTACFFNITRFMRDDPSYLWFEFKRKFKENHKQAALTGIICTAMIYIQILLWFQIYYQLVGGTYDGGLLWMVFAVLSIVLFFMITPYIFMHFAYVSLGTLQIIKNSFLMALVYLPRSFMGSICGGAMWIVIAWFFPNSLMILPIIPLILFSLSMMLFLSWTWPKFDKHFEVEETLKKKKEERESKITE